MFHVLIKPYMCVCYIWITMKKTSLKIGVHCVDILASYRCIGSYWCLL